MNEPFDKILKTFGNQLQKLRLEKALSLHEMSRKSTISIARLRRMENGEINIRVNTMRLLARALGVQLSDFFIDDSG
ncbi:helix-turn-helix domain-containing protein [Daejeonella lutea]|uniref:Helix-turn-helix n=1 Tax=Daejeonella lutea TaxID=572036 RepID=A0A1T5B1G7_9SPHI|nr:helix-turn-helix transcriptional regulator [Daejeonella lutea]SKB41086.1 Helix-turn-helix [Daejeonella lutea]